MKTFTKTALSALTCAVACILHAGCSPDGQASAAVPTTADPARAAESGLELVSVEDIQPVYPNMIANGGFEEWTEGMAAPVGFGLPDPRHSQVVMEEAQKAEGVRAAKQVWTEDDGIASFYKKLNVVQRNLDLQAQYTLRLSAANPSQNTVVITIGDVDITGVPHSDGSYPIANTKNVITIEPRTAMTEYTAAITPGLPGGAVIICTGIVGGLKEPGGAVIWDNWDLRLTSPKAD